MKVRNGIYTFPAILLLLLAEVRSIDYREPCTTPSQELGECVRVIHCPRFSPILQDSITDGIPVDAYNLLNQSFCGNWRNVPLYCCPPEIEVATIKTTTSSPRVEYGGSCTTPESRRGTCIRVTQCPQFVHLAGDENISQSDVALLNHSFCGTFRRAPLICCPSDSNISPTATSSRVTPPVSTSVEYGGSCTTPESRRGSCIRVTQCPQFAHLIWEENISQSDVALLNHSFCGTFRKAPLICCPSDSNISPTTTTSRSTLPVSTSVIVGKNCITPDGESGKCVRLGDCSHYSILLTSIPVPSGILKYLIRAKCGIMENKPLLCCPEEGAST